MRCRPVAHEHGMTAVHAPERIGVESLFRAAMRYEDTIETGNLVHVLRNGADVMRNHDQSQAQFLLQVMNIAFLTFIHITYPGV